MCACMCMMVHVCLFAYAHREVPALKAVYERANKCGVANLEWLSGQEAMALEPQLNAAAAFLSPNTGTAHKFSHLPLDCY